MTGAQPHTMPSWRSTSAAVALQLLPEESQVVPEGKLQDPYEPTEFTNVCAHVVEHVPWSGT